MRRARTVRLRRQDGRLRKHPVKLIHVDDDPQDDTDTTGWSPSPYFRMRYKLVRHPYLIRVSC